ncbi:MAG: hypothetical protein Q9207_002473 [Kuettlingeria erythrocarpa]
MAQAGNAAIFTSAGLIERKSYGISRIELQHTRRLRREQAKEAEAEKRSQLFRQQQDEQRLENEREAEASRVTKLGYAINKLKLGNPLTVEDQLVVAEDDRIREMIEREKKIAGPAGAELKAAIAKVAASEATHNEAAYDPAYNDAASRSGAYNPQPPPRPQIVEYDPDEPPAHFRTHLPPNHPRRQVRTKPAPPIFLPISQLLITLPTIIFTLLSHHLCCPDGFHWCPCGIIKRPYRFLAENPGLVFAPPVGLLAYAFWDEIVYQVARVLWVMFYVGVLMMAILVLLPSRQ